MSLLTRAAALALLALAVFPMADAEARDRHGHSRWDEIREDRRDARRAGVIAGAITYGVVRSANANEAEEHRDDCIRDTGDDDYCDRLAYREERQDRRDARRAAVMVGASTRAIVRNKRRHDRWDD